MTPLLKVGHVWVRLTIQVSVKRHLIVVEDVGDDRSDSGSWSTGSNILAITTTIHSAEEESAMEIRERKELGMTYMLCS